MRGICMDIYVANTLVQIGSYLQTRVDGTGGGQGAEVQTIFRSVKQTRKGGIYPRSAHSVLIFIVPNGASKVRRVEFPNPRFVFLK